MESNLSQSGLNAVGSNDHDVCTAQSVNTPRSVHTPSYDAVCHDDDEMTDTAVDEVMMLLREKVPEISGLELVSLGQCQKCPAAVGGSLPRFSPATGSFVQG